MRTAVVFVFVIALTAITTSLEACGGRVEGVDCSIEWVSVGGGRFGKPKYGPKEKCVDTTGEETLPNGRGR